MFLLTDTYHFCRGLAQTFYHLFTPSVTLQYPAKRWEMPERWRGVVRLVLDEKTGKGKCVGCYLCARMCPVQAIEVNTIEGSDHEKQVESFEVDISRCIFCGLCTEACPKGAITLSQDYELAVYDRSGMVYEQEVLQQGPVIKRYTK